MRVTLTEALRTIATRQERYYVYVLFDDVGKPFYVGKGAGIRIAAHESECSDGCNQSEKHRIIRAIWRRGAQVAYLLAGFTDNESKSHELERAIIAKLGRLDRRTGILANRSDGGEGLSPVWQPELWEARGALPIFDVPEPTLRQLSPPQFYAGVDYPLLAVWRSSPYAVQAFWEFSPNIDSLHLFDPDGLVPICIRLFVGPDLVIFDGMGVQAWTVCDARKLIATVLDRLAAGPESINGHVRIDARFGRIDLTYRLCQRLAYHSADLADCAAEIRAGNWVVDSPATICPSTIWPLRGAIGDKANLAIIASLKGSFYQPRA